MSDTGSQPAYEPATGAAVSGWLWIRSKEDGRLERERFGAVPFADVPPSPFYSPHPGWWFSARAWLDEDGTHVVIAHDCIDKRKVHIAPWPTWQALPDGRVSPSYQCDDCEVHTFLTIGWEAVPAPEGVDSNEAQHA